MEKQATDGPDEQANTSSTGSQNSTQVPVDQPTGESLQPDGVDNRQPMESEAPQGQPNTDARAQPEAPQDQTTSHPGAPPPYGQPVMGTAYAQPGYVQPQMVYVQQPTPEQMEAQQAAATQRYGQVISSIEQFASGEATVADVVKTLYTSTAQDTQLWKGVIVGAAAAVLLTSKPARDVMGKTMGSLFPGLKQKDKPVGKEEGIKTSNKEEK